MLKRNLLIKWLKCAYFCLDYVNGQYQVKDCCYMSIKKFKMEVIH